MNQLFISYSSYDAEFVREKIVKRLIEMGIASIWFDEFKIEPGDEISRRISEGIDTSSIFIIIMSKNSVKSNWVAKELSRAFRKNMNNEMRIIPMLVEDCDIPIELEGKHYIDLRSNAEHGATKLIEYLQKKLGIKPNAQQEIITKNLNIIKTGNYAQKLNALNVLIIKGEIETMIELVKSIEQYDPTTQSAILNTINDLNFKNEIIIKELQSLGKSDNNYLEVKAKALLLRFEDREYLNDILRKTMHLIPKVLNENDQNAYLLKDLVTTLSEIPHYKPDELKEIHRIIIKALKSPFKSVRLTAIGSAAQLASQIRTQPSLESSIRTSLRKLTESWDKDTAEIASNVFKMYKIMYFAQNPTDQKNID